MMKNGLIEEGGAEKHHGFQPVNVQPGKASEHPGLGICPHFEMLLEVAMLLGNKEEYIKNYREFCGLAVVSDSSSAHGFDDEKSPKTLCLHLNHALSHQIKCAESALASLSESEGESLTTQELADLDKLATLIPPISGEGSRTRTRDETLLYMKELLSRIEENASGRIVKIGAWHQKELGCDLMPEGSGPSKRYTQK